MRKSFMIVLLFAAGLAACSNYGKKVSQDYLEVYYKEGITKEQAQKTLDFLYPLWKEKSGKTNTKSIQLTKAGGDTINFRMVVNKDKLKGMDDETFYSMANVFSDSIFNGAPVNIVFADEKFKPIRSLTFKKTVAPADYGEKTTSGNIEVYANDISSQGAQELADFLNKTIAPDNTISFQISKNGEGLYVLKMVSSPAKAANLTDADFTDISSKVSEEILSGAPLIFQLTDDTFKPFRTFEYKIKGQATDSSSIQ